MDCVFLPILYIANMERIPTCRTIYIDWSKAVITTQESTRSTGVFIKRSMLAFALCRHVPSDFHITTLNLNLSRLEQQQGLFLTIPFQCWSIPNPDSFHQPPLEGTNVLATAGEWIVDAHAHL